MKNGTDAQIACNSFTANDMKLLADDVSEVIVPACGHFVPEEAPESLLAALIPFFTDIFSSNEWLPKCQTEL